ncbi:hypothetical protein F2Q68_00025620 [Brassica cretica]|uniref:Uncharacterized protein n=1 Tax=Brassica cretica TaxID=69181 RepID=A0A8S9IB04_BRACR|nr:hypothetical protein F2Q68_00025620 [Brassica cretica]
MSIDVDVSSTVDMLVYSDSSFSCSCIDSMWVGISCASSGVDVGRCSVGFLPSSDVLGNLSIDVEPSS